RARTPGGARGPRARGRHRDRTGQPLHEPDPGAARPRGGGRHGAVEGEGGAGDEPADPAGGDRRLHRPGPPPRPPAACAAGAHSPRARQRDPDSSRAARRLGGTVRPAGRRVGLLAACPGLPPARAPPARRRPRPPRSPSPGPRGAGALVTMPGAYDAGRLEWWRPAVDGAKEDGAVAPGSRAGEGSSVAFWGLMTFLFILL